MFASEKSRHAEPFASSTEERKEGEEGLGPEEEAEGQRRIDRKLPVVDVEFQMD